jgi:hypothetical protein
MRIIYGDIIVEIEPGEEQRAIFALNRLGLLESQQSQQHQMGTRVNVPPGNNKGEPPISPQQQCALVAWRTWTPCNWVGVQVPVGTPGSVG